MTCGDFAFNLHFPAHYGLAFAWAVKASHAFDAELQNYHMDQNKFLLCTCLILLLMQKYFYLSQTGLNFSLFVIYTYFFNLLSC